MDRQTKQKAMTLRIDMDTAEQLEAIAQVEGISTSAVVREALTRLIEERRANADFQNRLRDSIQRNRAILERLGS
jgi:predicted transcriptional regulator